MSTCEPELIGSSAKKIYEFILSAKEPSEVLLQALNLLIKQSINSPEHFPFLLYRINWFQSPFAHFHPQFLKIFRIYKVTSPHSCKVIYNMLIEGFFSTSSSQQALDCLANIFSEISDKKAVITALKENYPHKLCQLQLHQLYLRNMIELCKKFRIYRADFLQIVVQNLASFDTEVVAADQFVHKPFPDDQKIVEMRHSSSQNQLSNKLDLLLSELMAYLKDLSNDQTILNQILLVFQNKVLPIKTTKMVQLLVFLVAETNKSRANTFISFLLANIFDQKTEQNWYRIFTQSNFYLFSYISRSKRVSENAVFKTLGYLVQRLAQKLQEVEEVQIDSQVNLKEFMQKRQFLLIILQTIVMIKLGSQNRQHWRYNEIYERLLERCKAKLHFEYFFREQILNKMGIEVNNQSNLRIKFSNKFLPSTLQKTACFVEDLMRMQSEECTYSSLKEYQVSPRKLHKAETPISYCSETVI